MMAPYVPAHTSEAGDHLKTVKVKEVMVYNGSDLFTQLHDVIVERSVKTPTVRGEFHSTFTGFRQSTHYTRSVYVTEDLSNGFEAKFSGGYYRVSDSRHTNYGVAWNTLLTGSTGPGGFEDWNLRNRTETECLLKVQAQKINMGVALAESVKTANMIARRAITLFRCYRALRQGNFTYAYYCLFGRSAGVQVGKTASELWLEWQYGWRPLMDDVWGGIELVRKGFREKSLLFSVVRTRRNIIDPDRLLARRGVSTTTGRCTESCKVKLWGAVSDEGAYVTNNVGLLNPAVIAWELLPFSFVIDWLVPIGNWLESLTATLGVEFVGGNKVWRLDANVEATRDKYPDHTWLEVQRPAKSRMQMMAMTRSPYYTWPWPLPYWKSPFSTPHVVSAIALLHTGLSRR